MAKKRRQAAPPVSAAERSLEGALARLDRWWPWVLALVVLLLYSQTTRFAFLRWDDYQLVAANPRFNPVTWDGLWRFWRDEYLGFYIPVSYSVWALETLILGLDAGRFHAVNVLLHAVNVVLVYQVIRLLLVARAERLRRAAGHGGRGESGGRRLPSRLPLLAAAGALLFAVHPLQVETVAWVAGLQVLLPTCFALLALRAFFRSPPRPGMAGRLWPRGSGWLVLALLAKPSVVILGPLAVVLDIAVRGTPWRRALTNAGAWFLIALPFAIVAKLVQPDTLLFAAAPLWIRPFVALDALQFYVTRLVAPLDLAPDHGRTPEWLLDSGGWLRAMVVPALLAAGAFAAASRRRFTPLALLVAFVVALLPVLGLVPFLYQKFSTVADHYMYVPFLVVSLGVSLLLVELPSVHQLSSVAAVVVVAAVYTVLTLAQLPVWRDDGAFFAHALEHTPQSVLLRMNYAESLFRRGAYEESLAQYRAAARIRPHPDIYNNIGLTLVTLQRYDEALSTFEQALAEYPGDQDLLASLANLKRDLRR